MGRQHGEIHSDQREIQGRRTFAEDLHGGFSCQNRQSQRGRGAAILCGEQPSGDYKPGGIRSGAAGNEASKGQKPPHQRQEPVFRPAGLQLLRRNLRQQGMAQQRSLPQGDLAVQSEVRRERNRLPQPASGREGTAGSLCGGGEPADFQTGGDPERGGRVLSRSGGDLRAGTAALPACSGKRCPAPETDGHGAGERREGTGSGGIPASVPGGGGRVEPTGRRNGEDENEKGGQAAAEKQAAGIYGQAESGGAAGGL